MYEDDAFITKLRDTYRSTAPAPDDVRVPVDLSATRAARTRRRALATLGVAGVAASITTGLILTNHQSASQSDNQVQPAITSPVEPGDPAALGGLEYFASTTVSDWVTNADEVVLVDVTELDSDRVSLEVRQPIWSSPVEHPGVDTSVTIGASPLEGGTYVVALRWFPALCPTLGDPAVPGHWIVIGTGGYLPVIDGVVASRTSTPTPDSVEGLARGLRIDAVRAMLEGANPRPREPIPGDICD